MVWVSLDSASLNFSNRRMRTRLSGGVAGEERKLSPLCRLRPAWAHSYGCKSRHKLVTVSEVKRNCMRATECGEEAWSEAAGR